MVSGRFWAFSFDMSGFVLAEVSFTANHSKAAVCHFRATKKRRIRGLDLGIIGTVIISERPSSSGAIKKTTQQAAKSAVWSFSIHYKVNEFLQSDGICKRTLFPELA